MPGAVQSVQVSIRSSADRSEVSLPWELATTEVLASATPWRTFRWHKGQRHYSGTYWSATEHGHVIYESRLELARLSFADFDTSVKRIIAQPFLLGAQVEATIRRHVPDFLLLSDTALTVVDVKPRLQLSKPKVSFTLAWTKDVVERHGWRYEVWSEPPEAELGNLRFLAGFRRGWLLDRNLLDELRAADFEDMSLGEACKSLPDWPEPLVRSAIFHLLWTQHFTLDLTRPLSPSHVLNESDPARASKSSLPSAKQADQPHKDTAGTWVFGFAARLRPRSERLLRSTQSAGKPTHSRSGAASGP